MENIEISDKFAVQMRGITKIFNNHRALDFVNLDVKKGETHAILGENGAGKSTLMNILYGIYGADSGEIFINGKPVDIKNPSVAINHGIGMVHQHFMLIEKFSVMQNIILGNETTDKFGVINTRKARKKVQEIISKYNMNIDLKKKVRNISVGMQQKVEILKALYRGAEILILDEPTAVLTPYEIEELMNIIKNLKQDNKTVIIITHKLKEIKKSSETCTIIRKGKFIDRVDVIGQTEQNLAQKMVGREVKLHVNKTPAKPGKKIFEMQNINVLCDRNLKTVKNLSLELRKGEIYGLAGIEGNGQKELLEAIIGTRKVESGKIIMNNSEIQNTSTRNVLDHKISVIHEDRHKNSCVLSMSVADNMILTKYSKKPFCVNNMLNYEERDKFTEKLIQDYDIRPSNCKNQKIRNLSGGNQQKLIIAREISNDPDLLIAVQPTRGLDVGAIEYVHKILIKLRDQNKAILLISLELDEILDISDRIGVIYDGSIVGEFSQEMANENNIGLLMAGGKTNEAQDN